MKEGFRELTADQFKTESGGALAKAAKGAGLLLGVVSGGSRIFVEEFAFEGTIDEDGEFACCGGDGLGLTDARGEAPVEAT